MKGGELSERLAKLLEWPEAPLKAGGEFVAEQAPQVATELIRYTIARDIAGILLFSLLTLLLLIGHRGRYKSHKSAPSFSDNETFSGIGMFFFGLCAIFPPIGALINGAELLKVYFAPPRLFLLEYVADLLK